MDKPKVATKSKTVEYKIDSLRIINHTEKPFSEYGLTSSDIKKGSCQIGLNIHIDAPKSTISIPVKVVVSTEHESKQYELFTTEAMFTFKIKRFASLFKTKEPDKYKIPDAVMRTLIGTVVGGVRGIMVASCTVAEYKKIILPFVDTAKMLESVKNAPLS
jgi:hypothetical protein